MTDKDAIIAQLLEEIKMLRAEIAMLKEKVARLEKTSSNSSKPPSSDIVKPPKPAPADGTKRKIGGQSGHQKFARRPFGPEEVTPVICELSEYEAQGLEVLDEWYIFQQVRLPEKRCEVIEYRARMYYDCRTGRKFHAPLPDGVREGGLLAADINALIAFLKGACHASYTTIEQFFEQVLHLDISRSLLCKATQKASVAMADCHKQLLDRLRQEPQVGVDETGHHDNGKLHWTWCFQTRAYSLFYIADCRGSEPTNNDTERAVRHTVIDRRVTQGTRSDAGMRWCERIWTTIATCKKQRRNVFDFIHRAILAHWTKQPCPQLL